MFTFSQIFRGMPVHLKLSVVLITTLVNSFILYLIVSFILKYSKSFHARLKHYAWFSIMCIFLFIPLFSLMIPSPNLVSVQSSVNETLSHEAIEAKTGQQRTEALSVEASKRAEETAHYPVKAITTEYNVRNPNKSAYWQTLVMLIWLAGVVFSLIHIFIGRTGLHCMIKRSTPVSGNFFNSKLHTLCDRMGIRQKVQVWKSSLCITPFTCYLFKPVILLPQNTCKWSDDRLRVVLLHELAHIKRRDHVTRFIARFVCALLWFVPPVWIVYNKMQVEEEKACDALVIESGVKASDYASHIIKIARSTRGKVLSFMLQHSFSKRSMLEPRIRNILRLKNTRDQDKLGILIRLMVICFACLLVLHVVNPVSARNNSSMYKKEASVELIHGKWFNERDYNPWKCTPAAQYKGKIILCPDGCLHQYQTPNCPELSHLGHNSFYIIKDTYIDRRGNHLYQIAFSPPTNKTFVVYQLWRVDSSGSNLEITWDYNKFPTEIDPDKYEYYTFYRK